MKTIVKNMLKVFPVIGSLAVAHGQTGYLQPASVLFENVRIFDGKSSTLSEPSYVLVRGNKIVKIANAPIAMENNDNVAVIIGNGRTLMPGLIDAHYHLTMAEVSMQIMETADLGYLTLLSARSAADVLMRGFTSIRDMGGPTFSIKRGIDEGLIYGPRIWPSGAIISQTGGHADFRAPYQVPAAFNAPLSRPEEINAGVIADGVEQVLKRTREQLMLGATQIKLAAGGGVASLYDPLDVSQYTEAEFRAAVDAAENWGTYVTVHAYTSRAIRTAIAGGVKGIEHGQLMDEDTAKLIAEKGVWLNMQPFLDNEFGNQYPEGSPQQEKRAAMVAGTDRAYKLAKQYKIKLAWGTDTLFNPELAPKQGSILASMSQWFTAPEILRMATSNNAELLAMSGLRNPYPGKLGVVEEGALADLLLVDGNPLADIQLVADPVKNFVVIMKDGDIYKNTIGFRTASSE